MTFRSDALPLASLRAVLFDLDGTLVETRIDFPAMTAAMLARAAEAGVPLAAVAGKDILGMVDAAAAHVAERGGDGAAFRKAAFADLEHREVQGCAHPNLLPGTDTFLAQLQNAGIKIGIVTRNCRRVSVDLVARYRLPHDVLLTRDDVRLAKPHPEHLWDALRALGAAAGEAAMTGDHWMDVQAGQAAGCAATVGVLGRNSADWFAPCPPTFLVRDLGEALPLFRFPTAC